MFDAIRVYVALFYLVAADHRYPQPFPELSGESRFSRSRPAGDDDALWFLVHIPDYKHQAGPSGPALRNIYNRLTQRM